MAILKEKKLVVTLKGKSRSHEYQGSDEFVEAVNKPAQSGIDLKSEVNTDKKAVKPHKKSTKWPTRSGHKVRVGLVSVDNVGWVK